MDNASFHKDGIIRRLLRKAGCGLRYLPTYSPDLNKIKHYWAKVKKFHSRHMKKYGWRNGESVIESLQMCPNLTEQYYMPLVNFGAGPLAQRLEEIYLLKIPKEQQKQKVSELMSEYARSFEETLIRCERELEKG